MIHATDGCSTQHFHSTQRDGFRRAKDIINAPLVDGSLACVASQVTEIFQQVSIRFTILLRIVSEKIGPISDAHLEIEVARNERNLAFSVTASPINHVSNKCTAARRAEGIGMGAHEHNSGQVLVQTEVCSGCKPVARWEVVETQVAIATVSTFITLTTVGLILNEHGLNAIGAAATAHVAAILILQARQQYFQLILTGQFLKRHS